MVNIQSYDIQNKFTGTVIKTERITPSDQDEVRHIEVEVEAGDRDFHKSRDIGILTKAPEEFGSPNVIRLYSIAGIHENKDSQKTVLELCVKRCFYIDGISGEQYPGTVSNYLCNLNPGDNVDIIGPYGLAYTAPEDPQTNLLMIGQGTGIAPFRSFIKKIYEMHGEWKGKVRLFHGAKTGMELLYMNDEKKDFTNYYDKETFEAIKVIAPRPALDETIPLEAALAAKEKEIWEMLLDKKTNVYIAGLHKMQEQVNAAFSKIAGSPEKWAEQKQILLNEGRWFELLY